MAPLDSSSAERLVPELHMVSVVTPAFNESGNLPELHSRLEASLSQLGCDWEWIVVDDHSGDRTFGVISDIAARDARVSGVRLAHNSGSHAALLCGLLRAQGNCAIMMAADLQDPPDLVGRLVEKWRMGAQLVWAVRESRRGEKWSTLAFSRLFSLFMRHLAGMKEMPPSGAGAFLVDRVVMEALGRFSESSPNVYLLLFRMGFRQAHVGYDVQARVHGRSGWTFAKKVRLAVDSVTAFTYRPIRIMAAVGFATALGGFVYAAFVITNALRGRPPQGWSSLMVAVLLIGGLLMSMLGVLGEYLWRALDETRRRPRFLIEETTETEERGMRIEE